MLLKSPINTYQGTKDLSYKNGISKIALESNRVLLCLLLHALSTILQIMLPPCARYQKQHRLSQQGKPDFHLKEKLALNF